jgi:hypothetical protein
VLLPFVFLGLHVGAAFVTEREKSFAQQDHRRQRGQRFSGSSTGLTVSFHWYELHDCWITFYLRIAAWFRMKEEVFNRITNCSRASTPLSWFHPTKYHR